MMQHRFVPVATPDALDELFARSRETPVVLFQHDPYCGISAHAYDELAQLPGDTALIDVAAAPDLSRAVAARTGVRHESPQVLVLRDGRAAWAASHRAITAAAVARAIDERATAID